jgi:2-haloacid dehalogenase
VNEATEELVQQHPHLESPIRAFYGRWREMFRGPIEGTVQILSQLKEKGYRLYALSNWSAELFPQSKDDFPFLQWFDDILLSGEVQLTKPDPRIYQLLLSKYGLKPEQVLFIDDRQANVQAALQLGIDSIVFESPEQLEQQLITRQLL